LFGIALRPGNKKTYTGKSIGNKKGLQIAALS